MALLDGSWVLAEFSPFNLEIPGTPFPAIPGMPLVRPFDFSASAGILNISITFGFGRLVDDFTLTLYQNFSWPWFIFRAFGSSSIKLSLAGETSLFLHSSWEYLRLSAALLGPALAHSCPVLLKSSSLRSYDSLVLNPTKFDSVPYRG